MSKLTNNIQADCTGESETKIKEKSVNFRLELFNCLNSV